MTAGAVAVDLEARLTALRKGARAYRALPARIKNRVLLHAAHCLREQGQAILRANLEDLAALPPGSTDAFRDRLSLNPERLEQMAVSLEQVASLADPVGEVTERKTLANGLEVRRVRSPLGVIFMIFEARPNVVTEAFSLAFKAGNAMILRGGKESVRTVTALASLLHEALAHEKADAEGLWIVTDPDRQVVARLLEQKKWIDVVVPRGGDALIEYVTRVSRIPVIKNDRGLCHVYVHEDADPAMATRIVVNAKTSRPGVCNSMETLLVHQDIAASLLPEIYAAGEAFKLEWHGCPRTLSVLAGRARVFPATAESFDTEYLEFKLSCRVVASYEEALAHIEAHGSRHSEAIVTRSAETAARFQDEVDAAAVYWNASTRFTDGFELGLGGELGISTQKLHVRGPVGLKELTSVRWVIEGKGQIR